MGGYTLRLLDVTEKVAKVFEQEYQGALDALDAAKRLSSEGTIEVWTRYGRIARVKKDNKPAGP